MSNQLVVANKENTKYICLLDEFDRMVECHPFHDATQSLVGNIYNGVVKKKIKGLGGYFIDFGQEKQGFLPITTDTNRFSPGQTIMVQVKKDAYSTKGAKLSHSISITGDYFVLVNDSSDVHFSSKLSEDSRTKGIKSIVKRYINNEFGFIVRTNSYEASNEALISELEQLIKDYRNVLDIREYRTNYSILHQNQEGWLKYVRNMNKSELSHIFSDSDDDIKELNDYFAENGLHNNITVNKNENLYNSMDINGKLTKASQRKVWLSSGGSIVIDYTEAMTVVDVNSGKNVKKTNTHNNRLKINKEAARETLYQIRLRNLSGIIIIDFIDMAIPEHEVDLVEFMEKLALRDPVRVIVHGLTKLGIMEITRKRLEPSLREQLKNAGIKTTQY